MKQLVISLFCAGALLGTTMLMPLSCAAEGTWMQGGATTNSTSKGMQNAQKTITYAIAAASMISAGISLGTNYYHNLLNFDPIGIVLKAMLYNDARHRKGKLSEDIPELQAAVRQIGSAADLMSECEGSKEGETCNELNATLDRTRVHVSSLQNIGLEAIKDVTGNKVLKTSGELIGAKEFIQKGFGTEVSTADPTANLPSVNLSEADRKKLEEAMKAAKVQRTEMETANITTRKKAHLQLNGTAGVARADLGATVARSERAIDPELTKFVGSGDGVIANIKVLCGLDLTLSQRLNLLNMLQGQQVANDAAMALQFVED